MIKNILGFLYSYLFIKLKKRHRRIFDISPANHDFWEREVKEKVGKSWQCQKKGEKTDETDSRNYIAEEYESAKVPRTGDLQCVR